MRELETDELASVSGGGLLEDVLQAVTGIIISLGGGGPVSQPANNADLGIRG